MRIVKEPKETQPTKWVVSYKMDEKIARIYLRDKGYIEFTDKEIDTVFKDFLLQLNNHLSGKVSTFKILSSKYERLITEENN